MVRLAACLVALVTLATTSQAIPAFVPAKSERSTVGLAPTLQRRAMTVDQGASPQAVARAQQSFQDRISEQVKNVASKYPVDYMSNVSDYSMWEQFQDTGKLPEPIRGKTGSINDGPANPTVDRQNPDTYAPPSTDNGFIPQAKWPFALSHNRLQNGGWARQQNEHVLPVATQIAGVNMRLDEGAYREMHWHQQAEWAFVLNGTFRVGAVNSEGQNDISDVGPGDLWYFPSGVAHYIQSISPGGGEFLLVFDSGDFSEDGTLLLTDFTAHIPREVLVKNFPGFDNNDFNQSPASELYIFPGMMPTRNDSQQVAAPAGKMSNPLTHKFSQVKPTKLNGGSVKIVDSTTFHASTTIAAAEVVIEPGAMRELHWHPLADEWDYFIEGHARMTVFSGQSNARTYDFQAGDAGYLKSNNGHYIEKIGTTPVRYLEIFRAPKYSDVSLSNWMALTPPEVIKAHMGFSDDTMNRLQRFREKKHQIVPDNHNGGSHNKRALIDSPMIAGKRSWD